MRPDGRKEMAPGRRWLKARAPDHGEPERAHTHNDLVFSHVVIHRLVRDCWLPDGKEPAEGVTSNGNQEIQSLRTRRWAEGERKWKISLQTNVSERQS